MSQDSLLLADAFKHVCKQIDGGITNINPDTAIDGWQNLVRPQIPQFFVAGLEHIEHAGKAVSVLRLIHAMMSFSYSCSSVAFDLWSRLILNFNIKTEIEKLICIDGDEAQVGRTSRIAPQHGQSWKTITQKIKTSSDMKACLRGFAVEWFELLLVPYMAEGGTPEPGSASTATRNQKKLRDSLFKRDGYISSVGRILERFAPPAYIPAIQRIKASKLQAAHIIPFCTSSRSRMRELLEIFGGGDLVATQFIGQDINAPSNALLLAGDHHAAFGNFDFSIEAVSDGPIIRYRIKFFVPAYLLPPGIEIHKDEDEIIFGGGDDKSIEKPSPVLLNVHTALAKILHASRAAEVIEAIIREEEDLKAGAETGSEWGTAGVDYLIRRLSSAV